MNFNDPELTKQKVETIYRLLDPANTGSIGFYEFINVTFKAMKNFHLLARRMDNISFCNDGILNLKKFLKALELKEEEYKKCFEYAKYCD
mmetsp:Transcript_58187/g.126478  ORF Transcript_58187/g.126478 Transcript_58187/m.126478 type:complete len:90 (-) Transcript_58187:495-764(-)